MLGPEASRTRIARTLSAAYAGGLLSEDTFLHRVDQLLNARLIRPGGLIGDLALRPSSPGTWGPLRDAAHAAVRAIANAINSHAPDEPPLLALDWSGNQQELLVGRHPSCDVVLIDPSVSRRHARLVFRGSNWIVQDVGSTNGTILNGARIGRSELRPGDLLVLGDVILRID